MASKMRTFIQNGLLELSSEPGALPECTYFTHSHPNVIEDFLHEFHVDFPELLEEKDVFMAKMSSSYDAFMAGVWSARKKQK